MIVRSGPADTEVWRRLCLSDPRATFFQTPSWTNIAKAFGNGWCDASLAVTLRDGSAAVIPRMKRPAGRGLFASFESVPPGVYGSPISERPLTRDEMGALARFYRGSRVAWGVLVEAPFGPMDLAVARETASTQILRLSECPEDPARGYRKGHRSALNRARREGVHVTRAQSEEDFLGYYDAYMETQRRWSRRPHHVYPKGLFTALHRQAQTERRVLLWLALRGHRILAGALVLHHGQHVAYWHGASTEEGRAVQASHLVLHEAILDARAAGREIFDFMPSGGLSDIEHFKAGFGAQLLELGVHRFGPSRLYRFLSGVWRLSEVNASR